MSTHEAAEYLGVSKPTILRLWAQGLIQGYRLTNSPTSRVRLYRETVEAFDRKRKHQAATLPSRT
ncbi:MAG: excisionase family DNA-binding protein [Oscillochloridaceae bacterium umkhey_bin13]